MKKEIRVILPVLISSLVVAFFVWLLYIRLNNLNWDEAFHLYWTYQIYDSLKMGDFANFWNVTLQETFYPPFQSWVLSIPALMFGFSIVKVRIYWLFWLVLSSILIFIVTKKISRSLVMSDNESTISGYGAVFFLLTSPMVLFMSSMAMKEMMGMGIFLIIILTYFIARERRNPLLFLLVSLELFIAIMAKYNYGVLLTMILGLETAVTFIFCKKRLETILTGVLMFLPFLLLTLGWIFWPENKLERFLGVLQNSNPVSAGMSDTIGYLLFYPRAIIYMYSFTPLIGIFLLLSIFLSFLYIKNFRVRVLLIGVIINITLATYSLWNEQERYIFPVIQFLFILGGITLGLILFRVRKISGEKSYKLVQLGLFFLFLVIFAKDIISLPSYVYSVGAYTARSPVFNQTDYKDLFYEYNVSKWPKKLPEGEFSKPSEVLKWVTSNVDLSKPVQVVGQAAELAPDYFNLEFSIHKRSGEYPKIEGYSYFFVTLEILPNSKFYGWDYKKFNSYVETYIKQVQEDKSLTLLKEKMFDELGVRVKIYGKK